MNGCRFPHWRGALRSSFRVSWVSVFMTILPAACRMAGFEDECHAGSTANAFPWSIWLRPIWGCLIVPAAIAQIRLDGVTYRPIEGEPLAARLALASMKSLRPPVHDNLISLLPRECI